MNVVVCIKQVPARSVPMDRTLGVLDRSRAGGQLNPGDLYALEAGLRLARAAGGTVTALTMGPESARQSLHTALGMGVDRAVLLSDRAFAGADVYATACTLAQGIRALGPFDLVVCGQQTTDGDTAQLPFSLAVRLGIHALGWVKKLDEAEQTVEQELSLGTQRVPIQAPCLLAVGEGIGKPRIPSLRDQLTAKKKPIVCLGLSDLEERDPERYGLAASPTRVVSTREAAPVEGKEPVCRPPEELARLLLEACAPLVRSVPSDTERSGREERA